MALPTLVTVAALLAVPTTSPVEAQKALEERVRTLEQTQATSDAELQLAHREVRGLQEELNTLRENEQTERASLGADAGMLEQVAQHLAVADTLLVNGDEEAADEIAAAQSLLATRLGRAAPAGRTADLARSLSDAQAALVQMDGGRARYSLWEAAAALIDVNLSVTQSAVSP